MGDLDPNLILIPWTYPSQKPKLHLDRFSRVYTDNRRVSLYFTMGRPFPPSKLPLPMGDLDPNLIHGFLGRYSRKVVNGGRSYERS